MPEHYPKSPGLAIGLLGIGAGLGFFIGPQYAGWRAQTARWQLPAPFAGHEVADWQRPCVELGLAGLAVGALFLLLAREARARADARAHAPDPRSEASAHPPLGPRLRRRILAIAAVLSCRDFAGIANLSLTSVYLQKAHGLAVERVGFILGAMTLVSVAANPLMVWLCPGRRRLPALAASLLGAGAVLVTMPYWSVGSAFVVLTIFQAMHLGSYALSDAAMLERVPPIVRGRVVGLFLTLAGTLSATSPWVMGAWTDWLGERARTPAGYVIPFATLAGLMAGASASVFLLRGLGAIRPESRIEPMSEIDPATLEAVG